MKCLENPNVNNAQYSASKNPFSIRMKMFVYGKTSIGKFCLEFYQNGKDSHASKVLLD